MNVPILQNAGPGHWYAADPYTKHPSTNRDMRNRGCDRGCCYLDPPELMDTARFPRVPVRIWREQATASGVDISFETNSSVRRRYAEQSDPSDFRLPTCVINPGVAPDQGQVLPQLWPDFRPSAGSWLPDATRMLIWQNCAATVRLVVESAILSITLSGQGLIIPLGVHTRPFTLYVAGDAHGYDGSPPPGRTHTGAYRGWRKWKIDGTELTGPVFNSTPWHPGLNHAVGYQPSRGRSGGFYVCDSLSRLVGEPNQLVGKQFWAGALVLGSVLLTGRVRVGERGARASQATPEYLILTGNTDIDIRLLSIADRYGMTPLSWDDAEGIPSGWVDHTKRG